MYQAKHNLNDEDEVDEFTSVDSNKSHCPCYSFPLLMNFINEQDLIQEI